jgi:hypothetical protein
MPAKPKMTINFCKKIENIWFGGFLSFRQMKMAVPSPLTIPFLRKIGSFFHFKGGL